MSNPESEKPPIEIVMNPNLGISHEIVFIPKIEPDSKAIDYHPNSPKAYYDNEKEVHPPQYEPYDNKILVENTNPSIFLPEQPPHNPPYQYYQNLPPPINIPYQSQNIPYQKPYMDTVPHANNLNSYQAEVFQHPQINSYLKNDRKAFIRKVYALLSIQLLWTMIFTAIVVATPMIRDGIKATKGLVIAAVVICLVLILAIMCWKKAARRYPYNYIALFSFSLFESYIVAFICAYYDPYIVLCAAVITMAVAFSLTIYAWKSKKDFTVCGGIAISVSVSIVLFAIAMIFLNSNYLNLIFCEIFIIIYSVFIVYDTQLIAGGRYQEISYDDYVIGALILYVDIVGLFLYVLSFFGSKN